MWQPEDLAAQTLMTAATLPAGGSYTTPSYTALPYDNQGGRATTLLLVVAYTKHTSATTGQFRLRPMFTVGGVADVSATLVNMTAISTSTRYGRVPAYHLEVTGPAYTTAPEGIIAIPLVAPPFATAIKVPVAECGDTSHRGTCSIRLVCGAN